VPDTTRRRRSREEVVYVSRAIERERPPDEWPLILGEIVHNLRSSLDHVIYAQASRSSRSTQFPVFLDPGKFQVKGMPRLRDVPSNVKTTVESLQPFNVTPNAPERDWLWVLHDLWNTDKHRNLTTVATSVQVPLVSYVHPNTTTLVTEWADRKPLHDGTHVVTATVSGPGAEDAALDPHFTYQVTVEGLPLRGSLSKIVRATFDAVHRCETGVAPPDESFFKVWSPFQTAMGK